MPEEGAGAPDADSGVSYPGPQIVLARQHDTHRLDAARDAARYTGRGQKVPRRRAEPATESTVVLAHRPPVRESPWRVPPGSP